MLCGVSIKLQSFLILALQSYDNFNLYEFLIIILFLSFGKILVSNIILSIQNFSKVNNKIVLFQKD